MKKITAITLCCVTIVFLGYLVPLAFQVKAKETRHSTTTLVPKTSISTNQNETKLISENENLKLQLEQTQKKLAAHELTVKNLEQETSKLKKDSQIIIDPDQSVENAGKVIGSYLKSMLSEFNKLGPKYETSKNNSKELDPKDLETVANAIDLYGPTIAQFISVEHKLTNPVDHSKFKTAMMTTALDLQPTEAVQVEHILLNAYQEAYQRGLFSKDAQNKPDNTDDVEEELNQKTFEAIHKILPQEKQKSLQSLFASPLETGFDVSR